MDEVHEVHANDGTASLGDPAPDGTFSAGERGTAIEDADSVDVVVGEIPDPEDLSRMLWTARCDCAEHGLLGTFEDRAQAQECRELHLVREHGGQELS
jgi:hypothetical protein